jgi:tetratricopeptide (TPR) repeat protein
MRAAQKEHSRAYSHIFLDQIALANGAYEQGAPEQALAIWVKMRARFPDLTVTSEKGLNLLLDLGCYNEAEALLKDGLERFPGNAAFLGVGSARVAYRRGDLEVAIRRCEILRRKFPRVTEGYTVAATCLSDLGHQDEAEAMIRSGVSKCQYDADMLVRYAQHAARRCDWPEALLRWQRVIRQFQVVPGWLGAAQCLKEMGRFPEAENILTGACEHFHMNPWPFAESASLATTKGDFDEAVQRWESLLRQFPGFGFAYPKAAEALVKVGREAEADELLRVGITRSPEDLAINLEYARNAHRRADWAAASERWALVRDRFPDCAEALEQESALRHQQTKLAIGRHLMSEPEIVAIDPLIPARHETPGIV